MEGILPVAAAAYEGRVILISTLLYKCTVYTNSPHYILIISSYTVMKNKNVHTTRILLCKHIGNKHINASNVQTV